MHAPQVTEFQEVPTDFDLQFNKENTNSPGCEKSWFHSSVYGHL